MNLVSVEFVDVIRPHTRRELTQFKTYGVVFRPTPFKRVYISGSAKSDLEAMDALLEAKLKSGWYPKRIWQFWRKEHDDTAQPVSVLWD